MSIIPLGQTCNISFLLENAKLKQETSLFEWFVTKSLSSITKILVHIVDKTDSDILRQCGEHVYIGDGTIYSGHYTVDEFKPIYERRRTRLLESIRCGQPLLFVRFEIDKHIMYTCEEIDAFVTVIKRIHPDCSIKILLISPTRETLEHPVLINAYYAWENIHADPYCKGEAINTFFKNTLARLL